MTERLVTFNTDRDEQHPTVIKVTPRMTDYSGERSDKRPSEVYCCYQYREGEDTIGVGTITFHEGCPPSEGLNGWLDADVLAILRDRMMQHQLGPFECPENAQAITHMTRALEAMHRRRARRQAAGTSGTQIVEEVSEADEGVAGQTTGRMIAARHIAASVLIEALCRPDGEETASQELSRMRELADMIVERESIDGCDGAKRAHAELMGALTSNGESLSWSDFIERAGIYAEQHWPLLEEARARRKAADEGDGFADIRRLQGLLDGMVDRHADVQKAAAAMRETAAEGSEVKAAFAEVLEQLEASTKKVAEMQAEVISLRTRVNAEVTPGPRPMDMEKVQRIVTLEVCINAMGQPPTSTLLDDEGRDHLMNMRKDHARLLLDLTFNEIRQVRMERRELMTTAVVTPSTPEQVEEARRTIEAGLRGKKGRDLPRWLASDPGAVLIQSGATDSADLVERFAELVYAHWAKQSGDMLDMIERQHRVEQDRLDSKGAEGPDVDDLECVELLRAKIAAGYAGMDEFGQESCRRHAREFLLLIGHPGLAAAPAHESATQPLSPGEDYRARVAELLERFDAMPSTDEVAVIARLAREMQLAFVEWEMAQPWPADRVPTRCGYEAEEATRIHNEAQGCARSVQLQVRHERPVVMCIDDLGMVHLGHDGYQGPISTKQVDNLRAFVIEAGRRHEEAVKRIQADHLSGIVSRSADPKLQGFARIQALAPNSLLNQAKAKARRDQLRERFDWRLADVFAHFGVTDEMIGHLGPEAIERLKTKAEFSAPEVWNDTFREEYKTARAEAAGRDYERAEAYRAAVDVPVTLPPVPRISGEAVNVPATIDEEPHRLVDISARHDAAMLKGELVALHWFEDSGAAGITYNLTVDGVEIAVDAGTVTTPGALRHAWAVKFAAAILPDDDGVDMDVARLAHRFGLSASSFSDLPDDGPRLKEIMILVRHEEAEPAADVAPPEDDR